MSTLFKIFIQILDGEILEKPRSEKDATSMLHR